MKVKRVNSFRYEVEGATYVSIKVHYISDTMKSYELIVKRINQEWGYDRIKMYCRLNDMKEFLAKYDNERELLADYYMARLEGKFTL